MTFNKIFIVVVLLGAAAVVYFLLTALPVRVCAADACVNAEVVTKKADQQRGLQGRTGLGQNQGMLFVFTKDERYRFWMKDMKFPIDILWLDSQGLIVSVSENAPVCLADPCPVYAPPQDARYVLEVGAGFSRAHGFISGARAVIKNL